MIEATFAGMSAPDAHSVEATALLMLSGHLSGVITFGQGDGFVVNEGAEVVPALEGTVFIRVAGESGCFMPVAAAGSRMPVYQKMASRLDLKTAPGIAEDELARQIDTALWRWYLGLVGYARVHTLQLPARIMAEASSVS